MDDEKAFDWIMAALRIARDKPRIAYAGFSGLPERMLIYRNGRPVPNEFNQRLASRRWVPTLWIDNDNPVECWVDPNLIPHSQTLWWPDEARAILEDHR